MSLYSAQNDYAYGYQDYSSIPQNYYQAPQTFVREPEFGEDYSNLDYSEPVQNYWGVRDYSGGVYGSDYFVGRCPHPKKYCPPKRTRRGRKCFNCVKQNCNAIKKKDCRRWRKRTRKNKQGISRLASICIVLLSLSIYLIDYADNSLNVNNPYYGAPNDYETLPESGLDYSNYGLDYSAPSYAESNMMEYGTDYNEVDGILCWSVTHFTCFRMNLIMTKQQKCKTMMMMKTYLLVMRL